MSRQSCEHDYEAHYCPTCGLYQGDVCDHCGQWSDGADHRAARQRRRRIPPDRRV